MARKLKDEAENWRGKILCSLMGAGEVPMLEVSRGLARAGIPDAREKLFDRLEGRWGARTVPIAKAIHPEQRYLPHQEIVELVERAPFRTISQCYCRTHSENPCGNPTRTCLGLSFGTSDRDIMRLPRSRSASRRQALALIEECDRLGLVHQAVFFPSPQFFYVICNCCPCCCLPLSNYLERARDFQVPSAFVCRVAAESCAGCGRCVERCHFKAITVDRGRAVADQARCMGCGLCATGCPNRAAMLFAREDRREARDP